MSEDPPPERKRMVRPPSGGQEGGRGGGAAAKLKTPRDRTPSSQTWLRRQLADPFVARAKAQGFRSRAAFKLTEIDDRFHVLKRGARVVDLGCAPGGWLQVAIQRGASHVAGVDLLAVDPVRGAEILQMDFTDPSCPPALIAALGGPPDVVLSDMAPNTTGHRETDHLRIIGLVELAVQFAFDNLQPRGRLRDQGLHGRGHR